MILGIDPSALLETRSAGAHFYVNKEEIEPLSYMHDHNGVTLMRLRLWNDPYDEQGRPYGGGSVDYEKCLALAKEGLQKGYAILLDFHFSDFWCDPSKQPIPKAWQGLDYSHLCFALEDYVKTVLNALKKEEIPLSGVQIGNEITNGMLWPIGKLHDGGEGQPRKGYDNLCGLLKVASLSVREIYPETRILIHLEKSHDQAIYREFFDQVVAHEVPFDVIGMSYYPYWHGSFDMLFANVELMKSLYRKPVWIVETSYGFTTKPAYVDSEGWTPLVCDNLFENQEVRQPYPLTQEGQEEFLLNLLGQAQEHGVEAIVYWEPLWLPLPSLCWATEEGQDYINEHRETHNEWANQCLFDYNGEATKGFYAYSKK